MSPSRRHGSSRDPSRFLSRYRWRVVLAVLGLTLLFLPLAGRLGIESNLVALLPEGSPAADDYRSFLTRFGGFEKVFVLVLPGEKAAPDISTKEAGLEDGGSGLEGRDAELYEEDEAALLSGYLLESAQELAQRLRQLPGVARVRTGLEAEDESFFLRHVVRRAPLLLPEEALPGLEARLQPAAISQRVAMIRGRSSSISGSAMADLMKHDPLGFAEDLPLLTAGASLPLDPLTSAFLSPSGDAALLILDPALGEMDAAGGRQLLADLERTFAELSADLRQRAKDSGRPSSDDGSSDDGSNPGEGMEGADPWSDLPAMPTGDRAELRFLALGGPLYAAQDEAMLRRDLELTLITSAVGCTAFLLAVFGGAGIPLAALAVLGVALVATAGTIATTLGTVTAISFGFAAVLVGLGLDYAIHGGTSYRRHRLAGSDPEEALRQTFRGTGPGIATSALTTAAAFATLGAAHFRPLRELGIVTSVGILAILLASATLGAALLTGFGPGKSGRLWRWLELGVNKAVGVGVGYPKAVLGLALALTLGAVFGLAELQLDPDLRAMRPKNHPVFETERLLVESFSVGLDTSTLVVPGRDLDAALDAAAKVGALLHQTAPEVDVVSPTDWLVGKKAGEARRRVLAELPFDAAADSLESELVARGLAPRAFSPGIEALRALATGSDPDPPLPAEWPSGLAELVHLGSGTGDDGVWIALRLRAPEGLWPSGPPEELLQSLRREAPGAALASIPRIGKEMKALATRDMRSLAWIALALTLLVVGVSFRGHLPSVALAMLPVALGTTWALGLWGAAGRNLDLLSLAVIPILLGIGIDDGLHAVHGAGVAGGDLGKAVRRAGLAMTLTTLTTCVGFGSLLLSSVPGLERGGLVVSMGVLSCLFATLIVLPAIGTLIHLGPRREKPQGRRENDRV